MALSILLAFSIPEGSVLELGPLGLVVMALVLVGVGLATWITVWGDSLSEDDFTIITTVIFTLGVTALGVLLLAEFLQTTW